MRHGSRAKGQAHAPVFRLTGLPSMHRLLTFCNIRGRIGLTNHAGLTTPPRSDQPGAQS